MVPLIADLIRSDIANMEGYTPVIPFGVLSRKLGRRPEEIVKIDANENPYGPSPKAIEALARQPYYHIYPDPGQQALREALSEYVGASADSIMVGHGADELIDLVMRAFIEPGDKIIDCPPTFGMYRFDAGINHARVVRVWRNSDFSLDIEGVEEAVAREPRAKLLFVTRPNNPDGSVPEDADILRLLALPLVVILDEAYVEFHGRSLAGWVKSNPNLIVLRTFSKWAGLAGLRVGYGVFSNEIIEHLWKIKQPYNVNVAGTTAALASLEDVEYLLGNVARIVEERERLYLKLQRFDFLRPYPSRTNFILLRVVGREAHDLKMELERRGILIRYYDSPGLADHVRVSVGRPDQSDALLAALEEIASE
ncbi:MAG: histidinol-phosphate transaminase [Chloroflexota bacterium]|nr:histidinol-phosphate transaminase [Anaerolineae bacterium]